MKHNWEYKKLGDVCTVVGGCTPKTDNVEYWNGNLNWFTPAEISNSKYYSSSERKITEKAVNDTGLTLMPPGTVLLTSRAPIGKVGILTDYSYCNQGFKNLICGNQIFNEYLYYTLIHFNNVIKDKGRGATFKEISKTITESIYIPVPSMEVQEQIVAELDKINEVIADCRELLRTLDSLAQSLFYNYFGDPVTNPKDWPLKKLSTVSQLINGRAYKQSELLDKGKYKVIRVGNFFTNSDFYYSDLELSPEKYIEKGDLVFAWSASFGAFIWEGEKVIYHYHIWKVLYDETLLNKIFYRELLNEMTSSFMKDLHGIGMMHLTKSGMEEYMLPVPPLQLQEEYAARIEKIEEQKKAVEETISTLQALLDSRMDYWFN